jgi:hypothetical protein
MCVRFRAGGQGLVRASGLHLHQDALPAETAKPVRAMSTVPAAAAEILPVNRQPSIRDHRAQLRRG